MTTYKAIGKYAVDASDDEKRSALKEALCDATVELAQLGCSSDDIQDALDEAYNCAELELGEAW